MSSVSTFIDKLLDAAKVAAAVIPGTTDDAVIAGAEKLADLIGDLTGSAPDSRTQEQMQLDRKALRDAVTAKANATANRLDGQG